MVWAVVTEPVHVKQWQYGSDLHTDWSVGSSIRFRAEWDGQVFEPWGTVLAVDAPHRLQYSLFAPRPGLEDRPENYFTMTSTLEAEQDGTTLAISQDDPRVGTQEEQSTGEDENPVLAALKQLAESLHHTRRDGG